MIRYCLYQHQAIGNLSLSDVVSLVANIVTIVGITGLWFAYRSYENKQKEQKQNAEEKKKEQEEKDKEQKEKLKISVNMLWSEIEHNRKQLKIMIGELAKPNLPYPALETSAWETVDKSIMMDRLKVKDFADLLHIYNRVKTINMMYYSMLDKVNWIEDVQQKPVVKREFMNSLIERCKEALSYIDEVIPENFKKRS